MKVLLWKAEDSSETDITPADGKPFTLAQMQAFVGGMIEPIQFPDGTEIVGNEEARLVDLPTLNKRATDMWLKHYPLDKYPNNNPGNVVRDVLYLEDYPWNQD